MRKLVYFPLLAVLVLVCFSACKPNPLADAVRKGYGEKAAKKIELDVNAIEGRPLLMAAASSGSPKIIQLFINAKADLNVFDLEDGETPLIKATRNNYPEVVGQLIKAGVNVNKGMDKRPFKDFTPLQFAVLENFPEIVKLLVDAGADINAKNENSKSALMYAEEKENQEILEILQK